MNNKKAVVLLLATAIAIPAEGLRQYAYYAPPGILTACYGSTTNVVKGKKYSLDECRTRLDADMLQALSQVDQCVPNLPVNVLAAFADAVYNLGPTITCNTTKSQAARLLKAGKVIEACNQLPRWNGYNKTVLGKQIHITLPGLVKRREAERQLCLS